MQWVVQKLLALALLASIAGVPAVQWWLVHRTFGWHSMRKIPSRTWFIGFLASTVVLTAAGVAYVHHIVPMFALALLGFELPITSAYLTIAAKGWLHGSAVEPPAQIMIDHHGFSTTLVTRSPLVPVVFGAVAFPLWPVLVLLFRAVRLWPARRVEVRVLGPLLEVTTERGCSRLALEGLQHTLRTGWDGSSRLTLTSGDQRLVMSVGHDPDTLRPLLAAIRLAVEVDPGRAVYPEPPAALLRLRAADEVGSAE